MAKKISIIIPAYNEEQNIPLVYKKVREAIVKSGYDFEIIFVNDGSKDDTWKEICKVSQIDKGVKGISFSKNFGHACAIESGLLNSCGDAIIMMDADLQHPASLIPTLIKEWENGAQIVNTVRKETRGSSIFKKLTATIFYKLLNSISSLDLEDGEADFRLLDRSVVDVINKLPESPKFYRGIVNWVGFDVKRVEYVADARINGKSSYSLKKMIELARIGFTSFSMKPLKLIIAFGILLSSISFIGLLAMFYLKFFVSFNYVSNNVILTTIILFITGLLSVFQGIIAIYLVDIYNTSKGRPSFIIKEEIKHDGIDK